MSGENALILPHDPVEETAIDCFALLLTNSAFRQHFMMVLISVFRQKNNNN